MYEVIRFFEKGAGILSLFPKISINLLENLTSCLFTLNVSWYLSLVISKDFLLISQ